MKKIDYKAIYLGAGLLAAFTLWTLLLGVIDIRPIGPRGSSVGFATINLTVHRLIGSNINLYIITDWLGLVPIAVALGFAILGLCQLISRRSLLKVDHSILVLGVFYIAVIAAYLFFEYTAINYRPVLIDGFLEASYPSSTTLLTLCVMPTAAMQLTQRVKRTHLATALNVIIIAFTAFMVIGRLISGVHWITDIIGGILLSLGLVSLYRGFDRVKVD